MFAEKAGVFLRGDNLLIAQRTKVKALLTKNLYGEITSNALNHFLSPTLIFVPQEHSVQATIQ